MIFNFVGNETVLGTLKDGLFILANDLGFECSKDGIPVTLCKSNGNIEVSFICGKGSVSFNRKIHFFRALGLFIEAYSKGGDFTITEIPQFEICGVFIDCSRNAVLSPESLKRFIRYMAIMGLDTVMLYMEDTYTIKDLPYFGYMRGRYSADELRECDDHAFTFGIEIIPYIQVLGHLEQALKWGYAAQLRDTADILLAGNEKTYDFIEKMIISATSPLRSQKIGIGIDEAYNIGLGRYLEINGYKDRIDIMSEHIDRVLRIVSDLGLIPCMPSDMYLHMASSTDLFYDAEDVGQNIIDKVPNNVSLVYWDYYHEDEAFYIKMFELNRKLSRNIAFCGGISLWYGMGINYRKTFAASNAGLCAAKKEGITQVFAAMFGDDGSESNYFGGLLGMQLFAEHAYSSEFDGSMLASRFKACTKGNMEAFMSLGDIDDLEKSIGKVSEDSSGLFVCNPSKFLLYQDILIGLYDKHIEGINTYIYYCDLREKLEYYAESDLMFRNLFLTHSKLCAVLEMKADLGLRIKKCYDNADKDELKRIAYNELPELYNRVQELRQTHMRQWMATYKPFGWEVLDIRYGGILSRIDTARSRISDLLCGRISRIEELEEERLYFDESVKDKSSKLCGIGQYKRAVTTGVI